MRFLVWLVTGIVERDFWLGLIGIKRDSYGERKRFCYTCWSDECSHRQLHESFGDDLKRWWLQLWWPLIERYKLKEIRKELARAQVTTDSEEIQ
ncbi:MAG: hypothetical protein AAB490_02785 [Patescibacteria group bacterium]